MRILAVSCLVLTFAAHPTSAEDTVAKQYESLLEQYEDEGGVRAFAKRFLNLAAEHPEDPNAVDAAMWVISKVRGKAETEQAIEILLKHHVHSSKLGPGCMSLARSRCVAAEKMLRAVLAENPDQEIKAQACYGLALLLDDESNVVSQLKADPKLAPRILQYYGATYGKHLSSLDPKTLTKRREQNYVEMLKSFSKVKSDDSTLGEVATRNLFAIRHLAVGKVAPEITGTDLHGKSLKLSDYRGKVVMLSFWGHW